ncbi:MAG TPA: acetyltransferase [Ignavibacteriales bacterium]|nr:acetyltransferase [Ignavibacteriales bacterium]
MNSPNNKNETALGFHEFIDDKRNSALKKYQDIIIGNRNLLYLVKFEILTFFFMNMPGIPGLFLRQKFYKSLFRNCGAKVTFGIGISLKQPGKVSISKNSIIDDMVSMSVRGSDSSSIKLEDNVFIGRGSELKVREGTIIINSYSSVGSNCRISTAQGKISIGEYVFIAAYCYIGGGNHKSDRTDIPIAKQGFESKGGVTIGDDVWIGANCVIADGVKIGKGSIIGACSLVTKDIPEYSIAFGIPAKIHKSRLQASNFKNF